VLIFCVVYIFSRPLNIRLKNIRWPCRLCLMRIEDILKTYCIILIYHQLFYYFINHQIALKMYLNDTELICIMVTFGLEKKSKESKWRRRIKEWYKRRAPYSHEKLMNFLRMAEPDDYRNFLSKLTIKLCIAQHISNFVWFLQYIVQSLNIIYSTPLTILCNIIDHVGAGLLNIPIW